MAVLPDADRVTIWKQMMEELQFVIQRRYLTGA